MCCRSEQSKLDLSGWSKLVSQKADLSKQFVGGCQWVGFYK